MFTLSFFKLEYWQLFFTKFSNSVTLLELKWKRAMNVIYTPELWVCFVLLTYISAAAASPSPGVPALFSPSLSPCGRRGRMTRPRSRWRFQKQHEGGRSSAGWLQLEHESLSRWEETSQTALYYWHCGIWTNEMLCVLNEIKFIYHIFHVAVSA